MWDWLLELLTTFWELTLDLFGIEEEMAGTVTSDSTPIHNCDAVSTWTNAPTLDTEIYIEGTGSMSKKVSKTTSVHIYPIGVTDLSDTIIVVWVLGASVAQFDLKANGGIAIRVENGVAPEYTEWYVAGSDSGYEGGWQPLSIRTTETPDATSGGSADISNANGVGVSFTVTLGASKINCWWDNVHYGTTVTVTGGTSGSPATFADIITQELTSRWGFFTESEGVIFCQSKLAIGDAAGVSDTYFEDTSKIIVFRDKPVGTLYDITFQGNATGTTEIYWGESAGGRGVSGIIVSAAGTSKPTLTMTDTNITNIGLYGCLFLNLSTTALPAYDANYEVLSCNFEACDQVDPDDGTVTYCNFIATTSTTGALLIDQTDHRVTYCNFVNNDYAIEHPTDATYSHNNLQFAGNTVDINNSSLAVLVDSYQPTEDGDVDVYNGDIIRVAQQFTGTAGDLSRAIFSIRYQGSPTGDVYARLYANSGGAPTGVFLAESEPIDITTLTTSFADVPFEFEDEYTLAAATEYHISIEFDGGGAANRLEVEYLTAGDGAETCNTYVAAWGSQTYDCRFQSNRDGIVKVNATDSNPGTEEETNTVKGTTIIVNTVLIKLTCYDRDNDPIETVQCSIFRTSDGVELMNEDTLASGIASEDFNYPGTLVPIYWRARKSDSLDDPRYKAASGTGSVDAGGFSVVVTMSEQPLPI